MKGLGFEELHDGAWCRTAAVSFHYSVEHFHVEEGHLQAALQQHRAQCPKQCILGDLLGNHGWALACDGLQDR